MTNIYDNENEMTIEYAIKLMKKMGSCEFHSSMILDRFLQVCPKKWVKINGYFDIPSLNEKGKIAYNQFFHLLYKYRYALEYMTNGKIHYVGTNDLDSYIIDLDAKY